MILKHGSQPSKRVLLLITYHFPPSAAVGGMRIATFAKRLSALGWEPFVLTIRERHIERADPERLRYVSGIDICRVGMPPSVVQTYAAVKNRLRNFIGKPSREHATLSTLAASNSARRGGFCRSIKRYLLSFASLPDFERRWIIPATFAAVRQIRRNGIKCIMTSCPPYSVHLVGLAVKLITGVKWVADFRDPWMTKSFKRNYATCALSIGIESWLEKKVIEAADLVLFNVERLRDAYCERYGCASARKFVFIPNGINEVAHIEPGAKYQCFTLSYTGSFYVGRSPEPVFEAIAEMFAEGKASPEIIRIKLVGQCRNVGSLSVDALIRKYGLESIVEVCDPVSYSEASEIIRKSHLALLFAPGLPFQIPAKVYDYIASATRILAIAEDGGTADLICETGVGRAFRSEDVEGIKSFIYQEMRSQPISNGNFVAALNRFDAQRVTGDLVKYLDMVLEMETPYGCPS
jgi:glycosyl transferase family 4